MKSLPRFAPLITILALLVLVAIPTQVFLDSQHPTNITLNITKSTSQN